MRFSQEFIDRVLESNNIVDIISQHTQLRPSSGGHMGRCPFPDHPEKTPSFSVSQTKQVYHCFGCKKSGNLIKFLEVYNGMTFVQAIEYLAERANIPLPMNDHQKSQEEVEQQARKKEMLAVYARARDFFRAQLMTASADSTVKKYIQRRGISPETAETFQLGYAPQEWDGLVQDLLRQKRSLQVAEEGKLVKARDGKTGYYDFFRDRLMFPVHNFKGDVIAFGGRIIEQGEPKYLNSPEHFLFAKRKTLYGLHLTGRYIRSEDLVIVVEGYMDLISLYQAGIRNVVATMGTALTPEHAYHLRTLTQNALVLFDGDEAGVRAAEKALPILLAAGLRPRGITLPENQDPDDYVRRNGADALNRLAKEANDLFFLILQSWMVEFKGTPGEKLQIVDRVSPFLNAVQDSRLRELYEKELQFRLGVDRAWLRSAVGPTKAPGPQPQKNAPTVKSASLAQSEPNKIISEASEELAETVISIRSAAAHLKLLIALSLENERLFRSLLEAHWLTDITHPGILELLNRSQRLYRQAPEKFDKLTGLLMSFVDQSEALISPSAARKAKAPAEGFSESDSDPQLLELQQEDERLWMDCVRKLRDEALQSRAKALQLQLRSQPNPQLLVELQQVQQDRRRLIQDPMFLRNNPTEENL